MFGLKAIEIFIIIIAVFIVLYWITPKKHIWVPFLITTFLFAVLAYNIDFYPSDDMNIYFHHIDVFRKGGREGLQRALDENWFEWRTYRASLYYCYFISLLPSNHYLPALTIFIVYGLAFYVLYKASVRFEISKGYLFLAAIFFLSTYWYYDVVSGTRNGLAFTIAFACGYQHIAERKHIPLCYFGYLCAALTHSSGILPVLLVLIAVLTFNSSGKFLNFVLIFGMVGGGVLIEYLATKTNNAFIQSIAMRAESHTVAAPTTVTTTFMVNFSALCLVTILMAYFSYYYLNDEKSTEVKRLYKYCSISIFFMFGCSLSGLIFVRLTRWILPIVGALLLMIGLQFQKNEVQKHGLAYYKQNVPITQSLRIKIKPIIMTVLCLYTAVHFWYACKGSSLHWIRFIYEAYYD